MATAWSEVGYLGVAQLRKATDYDDSVAPADGQAILWVAAGGKFAPRTVVLPSDARLSDTRTPKTHAASHAPGGSDPLTGYVPSSAVGSASGVASLDSGGKVPQAQIPAIALTEYLGAVGSQAAMLALTGQRGDWCYRSDTGTDWQLVAEPSTSLASWQERHYPASPVSSVNGRAGAVSGLAEASDLAGYVPTGRSISAGTGLTGGGDLSSNRSLAVQYGTTAGTAAQGNDARLSDARTPVAHQHAVTDITPVIRSDGTIANAATYTPNASLASLYRVTAGGATMTLGAPSSPTDGAVVNVEVVAAAGGTAISIASAILLTTGISATINVSAGKRWFGGLRYVNGVGWFLLASGNQS